VFMAAPKVEILLYGHYPYLILLSGSRFDKNYASETGLINSQSTMSI
jgi:hypothetical protein